MKSLFSLLTFKEVIELRNWSGEGLSLSLTQKLLSYFKDLPEVTSDQRLMIIKGRNALDGIYIPSLNKFISRMDQKGEGANAEYFQISKRRGIKVSFYGMERREDLLKSSIYRDIEKEFSKQQRLSKRFSFVVKAYKIFEVFNTSTMDWTLGIVMEHVEVDRVLQEEDGENFNFKLGRKRISFHNEKSLEEIINKEFKKSRYYHQDIHFGNVLVSKNKIKVIDFDSVINR